MRQLFLKREGASCLMLFFAGWGMDDTPFRHWNPAFDLMLVYDYTDLNFDASCLADYSCVRVVAWSMGVWAADRVMGRERRHPLVRCTAVNGTLSPLDACRGIDPAIFTATSRHLNLSSLKKFYRRMCGSAAASEDFEILAPQRNIGSLRLELQALERFCLLNSGKPELRWEKAYVGMRDRIFSPDNQLRAWQEIEGVDVRRVDSAHYDKVLLDRLLDEEYE